MNGVPAVVFVVNEDSHAFIMAVGHGPVHDEVVAALQDMGARVVADHPDASRAKGGLKDRIRSAWQARR
jgi:hypothetical protein